MVSFPTIAETAGEIKDAMIETANEVKETGKAVINGSDLAGDIMGGTIKALVDVGTKKQPRYVDRIKSTWDFMTEFWE